MEVINNLGKSEVCQGDNTIYPLEVSLVTAIYSDGKVLACGGGATDQCFSFDKEKGWVKFSKMNQARQQSASIPINGGMVITGGYTTDGFTTLKSSQIVLLNGTATTEGPELPQPRHGHCLAYDEKDDVFFVTGGWDDDFKTTSWQFRDKEKFILIGTTEMIKSRSSHGCGFFKSDLHNGRQLLVVSGGSGTGIQSCEFYDFTEPDSQWQLCSKSNSTFFYLLGPNTTTTFQYQLISNVFFFHTKAYRHRF